MTTNPSDKSRPSFVPPDLGFAAPKPRGTPRKFTDARRRQYLDLLAAGRTRAFARSVVGISYAAVHRAEVVDPAFAAECKAATAAGVSQVEDALFATALAGNFNAQKMILERLDPERWRPPAEKVELSGQVTHELEAGDRLANIMALQAKLAERAALRAAPPDDADIIDVDSEEPPAD